MALRLAGRIKHFLKSQEGPTAVEYAVLLALIIVACLGAITVIGSNSNKTFTTAGKAANPGGS
ncbi:MAG TPA: Flp family type IVb pilin [Gemmataceae bacterium]|jgi:pilus assembly protein Flp/PilA|nr:Flp family type IVb pilin [Gemmataceae bacterium]